MRRTSIGRMVVIGHGWSTAVRNRKRKSAYWFLLDSEWLAHFKRHSGPGAMICKQGGGWLKRRGEVVQVEEKERDKEKEQKKKKKRKGKKEKKKETRAIVKGRRELEDRKESQRGRNQ